MLVPLLLAAALVACAGEPESSSDPAATTGSEQATEAPAASEESQEATSSSTEEPTTAEATSEPAAVPEQLQFTATTLEGDTFDGAELAGSPSVLWFWAPWCPICQAEAPEIAEAAAAHPGVTFVGVAARDEVPAMEAFVQNHDLDGFTHLADVDGAVWAQFGVTYQPAFAFVGADGSIEVISGRLSPSELDERLTAIGTG